MKALILITAMFASQLALSHTPVCRCQLAGQEVHCQGGYHDGSDAVDVTITVHSYGGNTLAAGKLNRDSQFHFALPHQAFYILMDAGPGEMFEVDWQDIDGIAPSHFQTSLTHTP